jgi:hypothetical protein
MHIKFLSTLIFSQFLIFSLHAEKSFFSNKKARAAFKEAAFGKLSRHPRKENGLDGFYFKIFQ